MEYNHQLVAMNNNMLMAVATENSDSRKRQREAAFDQEFLQDNASKRQKRIVKTANKWQILPRQVLYTVFTFLQKKELIPTGRVCSHWWTVSRTNLLWQQFDFVGFKVKSLQASIHFFKEIFSEPIKRLNRNEMNLTQAPVRILSFPRDCAAFGATEINLIRSTLPELVELKLPIVSPTQDVNMCQSIGDDILSEIAKISTLKRLDLSTHTQITNAGLSLVTRTCKNLIHLIVDHCAKITPAALIEAVRVNPSIRTVSALSCAQANFTSDQLVEFAQYASKLEEVSIELHQDLESDAVLNFSNMASNLKTLHFKNWKKMDGYTLSKICQVLQRLERLTLSGNEGSTKISSAWLKSEALKEITLTRCDAVKQFNIQCPNLNKLHFETIHSMNELNIEAPKLNQFMIRTTNFEGIDISKTIASLSQLKVLDVLDCLGFGSNLMIKSKSLNELSLYMCSDLEELSVECEGLKSMNVDVCMELKKAKVISPALQTSQWFTLPQPQFPLMSTLQLYSQKLQSLSLQRCVNLKQVELKCDKLVALNLADCKLLEELMLECPNLEKLALSAPRVVFTPEVIQALTANNPKVHMLSLSHAPGLSDEALAHMCSAWPSLQALIISNCESLRTPVIASRTLSGLQLNDCAHLVAPLINCPSLAKLFFRNSLALCDPALSQLTQRTINLKLIEVFNCPLLVQPRVELPSLMSASFNACANLKAPAFFVPNAQGMTFTDCASLDQLVFLGPTKVQEMTFQNCRLSDQMLEIVARCAPTINSIVCNNCEGLIQPRVQSRSLKALQFNDCNKLVRPMIAIPSLQSLIFKNCSRLLFQSLPLEVLHQYIVNIPQQQQLSVPLNSFPASSHLQTPLPQQQYPVALLPPSTAPQAVETQVLPRLSFLEFVNCGLAQQVDLSANAERLSVANCNQLTSLSVSNNCLAKIAVISCHALHNVEVNGSGMTEVLIRECPSLASFNPRNVKAVTCIKCPNLNDKTVEQITRAEVAQNLRVVVLDSCGISNPSIRHQDLHVLKISNSNALVDLHTELPSLQSLDVQNCQFLSLQFVLKLNAISNFLNLRNLVLKELKLTDVGLEKLLTRVIGRNLHHVDVASSLIQPMRANQIVSRFMQSQQQHLLYLPQQQHCAY